MAILILVLSIPTTPALAQGQASDLQISIDRSTAVIKTGDKVEYNTIVSNHGSLASPPLIIAMNLVNLDEKGDTVDPEDWAPKRTQYIQSLQPGETTSLHWIINTILDGNYMVYMVLIPAPADNDSTSQAVATSGIHLTVHPFTRLNPGGVLPYAIGAPLIVLTLILFVHRRRNILIYSGDSFNSFLGDIQ
jgi:hypothetical protein